MVLRALQRYMKLSLLVLGASVAFTAGAHTDDEGPDQTKLTAAVSQSNISHDNDDRIRFVPDNLFSVDFVGTMHGWAAGYYGTILKTVDGGESWERISLPGTDLIRRIQFLDENRGWLVTHRGRIMSSEDGGVTWESRHTETNHTNLRNIKFFNPEIGWAVGHEGTILHTRDGGETWVSQSLDNYLGRDLPRLNGLTVLSETEAYLAGEFGVIAETTDAGQTWTIISSPDFKPTFTEIEKIGNSILAVGLDGVVVNVRFERDGLPVSSEGGASKRVDVINTGVNQHFFDIVANDNGEGVIVGLANILIIREGLELSEFRISRPDRNYLYFMGATPIDDSQYVVVGARGLAVKLNTATAEITGLVKW